MHTYVRLVLIGIAALLVAATAGACSDDDAIDSTEAARRAYLGLDPSIGKSLQLGFDGFNAATSANIAPQSMSGDHTGTLTITGQVDAGVSANKEMNLRVGMVDYSDGEFTIQYDDTEARVDLSYDTSEVQTELPSLALSLRNIPDGTFTGTLTGRYQVHGDLAGLVDLSLALSGELRSDGEGGTERTPGTTVVTGTATSGDGLYEVSLTL